MRPAVLVGAVFALGAIAAPVRAAPPNIIIFGGGWGPEGTQHSLELQVSGLARALAGRSPTVLFAAGSGDIRAVQVAGPVDETAELLGMIFNQRRDLRATYRPARIKAVGAASRAQVLLALDHSRRTQGATVVFGVGHGSPGEHGRSAALELWGPDDHLTPTDMAAALDATRGGPTAFVLGQCHSGAFTVVSHVGGRPSAPLATPARCVFAAAPADREASGCTTDISAPDADAYMVQVTAALSAAAGQADIDGDGAVSLAEAHAYARIHDPTVDVPVASSDRWLARQLGKSAPAASGFDLVQLVAQARPIEQRVLTALGPEYVRRPDGVVRAEADRQRLQDELGRLHDAYDAAHEQFDITRNLVLDRVLLRWPELANPYHPVSRALLAGPAPAVVGLIKAQPELSELRRLEAEASALDGRIMAVDKRLARLERWLMAVQAAANERFLRRQGGSAPSKLDAILACESLIP